MKLKQRAFKQEETEKTERFDRFSSVISVCSCSILFLLLRSQSAFAHEVRPGYLELRQTGPETYDALWKVPGQGDLRFGLYVELPASCTNVTQPRGSMVNNAYTERWSVKCAGGLQAARFTSPASVGRESMCSCVWSVSTALRR